MTNSTGRPTSFEDLDQYEQAADRLASFTVTAFEDDPELLRAYADFIHAALNAGHTVEHGEVLAFLTDKEREAKVVRAQRNWDTNKKAFDAWVNDGVVPTYKASVESWARSQGLAIPEAVSA